MAGRPINPHSDRQTALRAAVKVMRQARKPLTRKVIAQRCDVQLDVGTILTEAFARDARIPVGRNVYRIVRPARGLYGVERVT